MSDLVRVAAVGELVGYVVSPEQTYAAIITEISEASHGHEAVSLTVFAPSGLGFLSDVPYGSTARVGTWHWIQRACHA